MEVYSVPTAPLWFRPFALSFPLLAGRLEECSVRKYWPVLLILIAAAALIGVALALSTRAATPPAMSSMPMPEATEDPRRDMLLAADPGLQAGRDQYNLRCAHCHGYDGEGEIQVSAVDTLALGMKVVPPHNATSHTWMHPEQLLVQFVRQGAPNPLFRFQMPAYGEVLTDDEIRQILDYISLWWTDSQREHYQALTAARAEIEAQFPTGS